MKCFFVKKSDWKLKTNEASVIYLCICIHLFATFQS